MGNNAFFFRFRFCIAIFVALSSCALPVQSQVYVGGELTSDATFSPVNNPYIVTEDLIVNLGVTLTIQPGVELLFEYGTGLISNGIFIAKGSAANPILFNPKNQLPFSGQWAGIVINRAKTSLDQEGNYVSGSLLSCAVISKASCSVTLGDSTALLVENVKIDKCYYGVFLKESSSNTIRNCSFISAGFGIYIASGFFSTDNILKGNSFYGSSDIAIFINSSPDSSHHNLISGNRIASCNTGLQIGNYEQYGISSNTIDENVFYENKDAIKLFQDSTTIMDNYFIRNGTGITCWFSKNNLVKQNLFAANSFYAITLTAGSSSNTITYNNICQNEGGVWIKSDNSSNSLYNSVLNNSIHGNASHSLLIENSPQGPVQFNNICFNGDYLSFDNQSQGVVQAGYGFWAKNTEPGIDSIIYDLYDDSLRGEVVYKPFLDEPITSAPIIAPRLVIKQKIGSNVVVSWDSITFSSFHHYAVHFGKTDGIVFEHGIDNKKLTSINMGDFPFPDTIAVSALDIQADGMRDQTEGHESEYAYALLFPYAGPDTAICYNMGYSNSAATALNYESLTWTTSGDGYFNSPHILNPVYKPGPADLMKGDVTLTLHSISPEYQASDITHITFLYAPTAFAGNDTIITADSSLRLLDATAQGYMYLKWITSGDGSYDNDTLLNPVYTPGPADVVSGKVTLVFIAFSPCGYKIDSMDVIIIPGFSVKGRVHAGNNLAANTNICVYSLAQSQMKDVSKNLITTDGNFEIKALAEGDYYFYFIPDKELFPGFVPVYFFDDLIWENAEKIRVNTDVYDVDIQLYKKPVQLPEGEGMLSGYCTPASGSDERCDDITVMLYDPALKNIFDWENVREGGNFRFRNLPFGQYVLSGEKAGIPAFHSPVLWLTPLQPSVGNIELICSGEGYKFLVPDQSDGNGQDGIINVFPNPFTNYLNISNLTEGSTVKIMNAQGEVCTPKELSSPSNVISLSMDSFPVGFYIIEVSENGICLLRKKIIKL